MALVICQISSTFAVNAANLADFYISHPHLYTSLQISSYLNTKPLHPFDTLNQEDVMHQMNLKGTHEYISHRTFWRHSLSQCD